MLVNVVDGRPEGYLTLAEAARKFGVQKQTVVKWYKQGGFDDSEVFFIRNDDAIVAYYISEQALRPTLVSKRGLHLKKKPLPYDFTINVLNDISKYYSIPEGEEVSSERLEEIMTSALSERDRYVVRAFYDKSMSLREIGNLLNVTAERIRQIKLRALKKISHRIAAEKYWLELEDKRYLISNGGLEGLDLSVRAWNCLLRDGVETLDELLEMTPDQIARIIGLGRKTYQEIFDKIHGHGYNFKWEERE